MLTDEEIAVLMNADMNLENLLSVRILLATGVRISELNNALKANVSVRVQKYPGLRVEIYPGVLAACHAVGEWQV